MHAFLSPSVFLARRAPTLPARVSASPSRPRASASPSDDPPSPVSLDTLDNFESFCWRAQDWLCSQTAQADGLGTFTTPPPTYPPPATPSRRCQRVMRGGRAFDTAVVSVWRTTPAELSTTRRRAITYIDRRTARVHYLKEAAGVAMKLTPRDPAAPMLRADAHYFQIGGGSVSWWFSGTADLSIGREAHPAAFEDALKPFMNTWEKLRARHRVPASAASRKFLDECFKAEGHDGQAVAGGAGGMDRMTAFGFITEVVDALLPAYLPLLAGAGRTERYAAEFSGLEGPWDVEGRSAAEESEGVFGDEEVDNFCIEGGAACESSTMKAGSLGSWRFSLAPSLFTPAGKTYVTLRGDYRGTNGSTLYL